MSLIWGVGVVYIAGRIPVGGAYFFKYFEVLVTAFVFRQQQSTI